MIAIRGGGYGAEWAENFNLGKDGKYHKGFEKAADNIKVYTDKYITEKCKGDRVKLWITGFSRGGAIANILAAKYNEMACENISVSAYTFASPNTVLKDEKVMYNNIFNFVNPYDTITTLPPTEWGFEREGTDVVIPLKTKDESNAELYKEVSGILTQFTGENYNLAYDDRMKSVREIMLVLAKTREEFSVRYEPLFKDIMLFFMTRVKKDKWEKIGFKEFLMMKYSGKAKNAYDRIESNKHVISAGELGITLPEEFADFIALTEIHKLNNKNEFVISTIKVETIKNLFNSFSEDVFDVGARLHSPEVYLAWLKVYDYEN